MKTDTTPEIPGLEALGGMTAKLDQENRQDTGADGPKPQSQADKEKSEAGAKEWAQIPQMLGSLACMIEPELAKFYTWQACLSWGKSAQRTAEKYGWTGPDNMPELTLAASTIGFAIPTFLFLRVRIRQVNQAQNGSVTDRFRLWWAMRGRGRKGQAPAAEAPAAEAAAPQAAG